MKRLSLPFLSRPAARLVTLALGLLPAVAMAHPGHYHPEEEDEFDSFGLGLGHPFTGVDHLLLAIAVGWFAFMPGKAKAKFSLMAFLASMAAGAWAGRGMQTGMTLEILIAITLVCAGAAFFLVKRSQATVILSAITAAGFIHGFAHGSEVATGISFAPYVAGILAGSAVLALSGMALHRAAAKWNKPLLPRVAGAALIAAGSMVLTQAL